ncbi:MAG: hypothetical protein CR975_00325 [Gammaproteobacteria bacterium]|nr:MAG: hypothetical protein CR975_00325 [Gammaproteobacteria bacterium]
MVFFICLVLIVGFVLLTEVRSTKKQLNTLRQRVIELSERLVQLEKPSPTAGDTLIPPAKDKASAIQQHGPQTAELTQPGPRAASLATAPANSGHQTLTTPTATARANKVTPEKPVTATGHNDKNSVTNTVTDRQQPTIRHTAKQPAGPSFWDKGIDYAKTWLTTGNIPVKIGMLVLIATVIAFLRYASNQGWLRLPIEYKLLGTAAAALVALAFAWFKRENKRSFSLSVQGGSIGILLVVIFAAVKMYALLSPDMGFIFSVLAVLLAAILALQQDAKSLAIMAILAGFLAPIWLSNGGGNHVVLFSYYAILNLGIFVIAWLKPWRELNLLGFIFTYVIGSTWGGLRYNEMHFASTEPFVILFFLFYLLIPLRYVSCQEDSRTIPNRRIDSALLFGTPLVTLALQVGMLYNNTDKLALSCLAMGLIYALLAGLLRGKAVYQTLQKAYIGLSAGFITLAVPIGLSAKATTTIFALEGAGAIWLGTRENRRLTWAAGASLQLGAAVGFAFAYAQVNDFPRAVINDYYLNALLIAVAGWISTWICYRNVEKTGTTKGLFSGETLSLSARLFCVWGMLWWLGSAMHEISHYSPTLRQLHDVFLLLSLTALALVVAYRYYRDHLMPASVTVLLISGLGFAALRLCVVILWHPSHTTVKQDLFGVFHPVTAYQLMTWGLYAAIGLWSWRRLKNTTHTWINTAIAAWVLALATTLSTFIYQYLPVAWHTSGRYWWAITAVWLTLTAVLSYVPDIAIKIGQRRQDQRWQRYVAIASALILLLCFTRLLTLSGKEIIVWLPVLNSVELLQLTIIGLLLSGLIRSPTKYPTQKLQAASYVLLVPMIISMTWRMTRHWIGQSDTEIVTNLSLFGDWYYLAIYGFWVVLALAIVFVLPKYIARLSPQYSLISEAALNSIIALLAVVWIYLLTFAGNAAPLVWIPLLNPLAVLQWSILALVWLWMRKYSVRINRSQRSLIIPVLMLLLISVMTLRFVHHSAAIEWDVSMFANAITQMALTMVWSILGVISWIVGSKRESRPIWLLGAVLMSVVLLKLVLVDRAHLGNLYGILSFFAYGLLCVIVGYFAPVPPSDKQVAKQTSEKAVET